MSMKEVMKEHESKDKITIKFTESKNNGMGVMIHGTVTNEQMMGAIVSLMDRFSINSEMPIDKTVEMAYKNLMMNRLMKEAPDDLKKKIKDLMDELEKD